MTENAVPSTELTIALLFDRVVPQLETDWETALADCSDKLPATLFSAVFDAHSKHPTEFKNIICKADRSQIRSSISFHIGVSSPAWLNPADQLEKQYKIALQLIELLAPSYIWWLPSGIVTTSQYFETRFREYLSDGEVFPVLTCVNFKDDDAGIISSCGLAWFCGQEIECHLQHLPADECMMKMARVANSMIINGPVLFDMTLDGSENGEKYLLRPNRQNRIIMTKAQPSYSVKLH